MVTVAKEGGLDWASRPNLDVVGIVYLLTLGLATIPVVIGSVLLFRYRRLPFIRMRNVSLVLSSLAVLHVCLCMFLLLYPLNGRMPCQTEYWSMIICLSVGVALFQAQNMQLLSLSSQQRSLLHHSGWFQRRSGRWWRFKITKPRQSWANLTLPQPTYFRVGRGIVVVVRKRWPRPRPRDTLRGRRAEHASAPVYHGLCPLLHLADLPSLGCVGENTRLSFQLSAKC